MLLCVMFILGFKTKKTYKRELLGGPLPQDRKKELLSQKNGHFVQNNQTLFLKELSFAFLVNYHQI